MTQLEPQIVGVKEARTGESSEVLFVCINSNLKIIAPILQEQSRLMLGCRVKVFAFFKVSDLWSRSSQFAVVARLQVSMTQRPD